MPSRWQTRRPPPPCAVPPARWAPPREIRIFDGRAADFREAYVTLQGLEIARTHAAFLDDAPSFGPTIQPRFDGVRDLDPAADTRWRAWRAREAARLGALLPPGTLLLMPTSPSIAPLRFLRDEAAGRFYEAALTLCSVAGHAGLPVVNLPVATLHDCPLGLSVVAGPGQDEALLAAARTLA